MGVTVYTKENCGRCDALKAFLDKHGIAYKERDILDEEVAKELLKSDYIIRNFCDEKGCIVITPIVNVDGMWMHKEFFDVNGFSEQRSLKIFNLLRQ